LSSGGLAPPVYLDASALIKLFVPEEGSDRLNESVVGLEDVIVSDLALTELSSALGRRVREGATSLKQARRIRAEAQAVAGLCRRAELQRSVHELAERVLVTSSLPVRTHDALHIALALSNQAATLVTFDQRLRSVGAAHNLFVAPDWVE
jgi:predicted nucleic acid-binding protein